MLAARDVRRRLDDVLASRLRDLDANPAPARRRQLQLGLATLVRSAMAAAETAETDTSATSSVLDVAGGLRAARDAWSSAPRWRRWLRRLVLGRARVVTEHEHALVLELLGRHDGRLGALETAPVSESSAPSRRTTTGKPLARRARHEIDAQPRATTRRG
jgi:hypothetical protein